MFLYTQNFHKVSNAVYTCFHCLEACQLILTGMAGVYTAGNAQFWEHQDPGWSTCMEYKYSNGEDGLTSARLHVWSTSRVGSG